MEKKLYNADIITLDGRMDEPVWQELPEYTDFRKLVKFGGGLAEERTAFKILPCEDRIIVGVKCYEPRTMDHLIATQHSKAIFGSHHVELFFSPAGTSYEFYQFAVSVDERMDAYYYAESGNIQPDPYAPDWKCASYIGDGFWSTEIEIPLSSFYMTPHTRWSDKWLMNVTRCRISEEDHSHYSSWCRLPNGFLQSTGYASVTGFPVRPKEDDLWMTAVLADLEGQNEQGYFGNLIVKTTNAAAGEYRLETDYTEPANVTLAAGDNVLSVPCQLPEEGRVKMSVSLIRISDGKVFKRYYPTWVKYEPIKITFTLPEYRNNFYPGQDCSKIVGKAISAKAVTLKLEGPGIETQTKTPDADGNFTFETPGFAYGDAFLTATIDGYETKKKIRRLAPRNHMMTWISGGNIIVNGKAVLRRNVYGTFDRASIVFERKVMNDNLSETRQFTQVSILPHRVNKTSEQEGGEALQDRMPSEETLRVIDEIMESVKDKEFTHYYIQDEPECRQVSTVYMEHFYNYIAEKDPYHVICMSSRAAGEFVNAADWIETHPYINPYISEDGSRKYGRDFNTMGKYVDDIALLNRPDKCIGLLPGVHAEKYHSLTFDYPTFDEYVCHVWAMMIRGGKSIWPYAFHHYNERSYIYESLKYIFSSFEALEDILLFAKRTTLVKTPEYEAVHYDYNGEKMFVLVNLSTEPQKVTLEGIEGKWHNFRHIGEITGNTFELKPLEVVIGTSEIRDLGMTVYEDLMAKIEKLEYERTHTGSLLFGHEGDMEITLSKKTCCFSRTYSLFDGVRDNMGVRLYGEGEKFIELDLTKFRPSFRKIVMHGNEVSGMKVKVRNGGELSVPAISKQGKISKFCYTVELEEAISPECLRLEYDFDKTRVELFEIEVF